MTKHDAVERPKHYPADFFNSICFALGLNKNDIVFFNVLKYVVRHEDKNGMRIFARRSSTYVWVSLNNLSN